MYIFDCFAKKVNVFASALMFCCLLVVSVSSSGQAAEAFRVVGLPFAPYIIVDEDKNVSGIVVDIIREAAQLAGVDVKFQIDNWPRAYATVTNGRAEAIIPTMKSPDREKILYFPEQSIIPLDMVLVSKKNSDIKFDGTIDFLKNYKLGQIRNARISPDFDKARESGLLLVEERTSSDLLIKAVVHGRLDAVAMSKQTALWTAKNLNSLDKIQIIETILESVPTYIAFSREAASPTLIKKMEEAIGTVFATGVNKAIIKKYASEGF